MTLIGPFSQLLTMDHLPLGGRISDDSLSIIENGGVLISDGKVVEVGKFNDLQKLNPKRHDHISKSSVALPGFIDAHTHLCFAGSREKDYALRVSGVSYQQIAKEGGGILDTVSKTRQASPENLLASLLQKLEKQLKQGVTTCEIKSGYGLSIEDELKILKVIQQAKTKQPINLLATCLAAHTKPKEFSTAKSYLQYLTKELLPIVKRDSLSNRIDIFIEEGAFSKEEGFEYLSAAKNMGFRLCVHANQFSSGGAEIAAQLHADSADHLEIITKEECRLLIKHHVPGIVLPGASLGLGMPYAPARLMLDEGMCLAIASDWNPGSAPMAGQLILQASVLGAFEKLTIAETLSGLTFRSAAALNLKDRGILRKGLKADLTIFPCADFREILYYQGSLFPSHVVIDGAMIQLNEENTHVQ